MRLSIRHSIYSPHHNKTFIEGKQGKDDQKCVVGEDVNETYRRSARIVNGTFGGRVEIVNRTFGGRVEIVNGTFGGRVEIVNGTFGGRVEIVNGACGGSAEVVNATFCGRTEVVNGIALTHGYLQETCEKQHSLTLVLLRGGLYQPPP